MTTNGKTVLITGADGGLGRDMAACLAEAGWSLILVDRSSTIAQLPELLGLASYQAQTRQCDLADEAQLDALCKEVSEGTLRCDALINNAGISSYGRDGQRLSIDEIDRNHLQNVLAINLIAPFLLSRAALPHMRERGWGRLIHIASRGGRTFSEVFPSSFSASKSGLIGLSRSIAGESARFGITSNVIAPGVIITPQSGKVDPALLSQAKIPAQRYGQPAEITGAVAYLLSDAAGFTTGAVMDINGGAFMPS
ncbi:SDR family NAD(P)-dependent oxidoreductase [Pseudomonas typographi]|uniref:SDR family NAD(P)-dependent oxidoreductase n=1 Tax=Pseudomonas typographi TaxID=2715964 RepID=UPI001684B2E5|nr:SDR family NAD(P)-dependent oxidoreductase [Pseudomonas typographi]MBD1553097.1 SDR family oxidoreductase [Pseudomonas typographi]